MKLFSLLFSALLVVGVVPPRELKILYECKYDETGSIKSRKQKFYPLVKGDSMIIRIDPSPIIRNQININSSYTEPMSVILSDLNGNVYFTGELDETPAGVDASAIPNGYFIITVMGEDFVESYKLIKE